MSGVIQARPGDELKGQQNASYLSRGRSKINKNTSAAAWHQITEKKAARVRTRGRCDARGGAAVLPGGGNRVQEAAKPTNSSHVAFGVQSERTTEIYLRHSALLLRATLRNIS